MLTTFQIPRVLQETVQGRRELQLNGLTVRDLLDEVRRKYPVLFSCVCDETGAVRRHINLFVNHDFLRDREGLDTKLKPGDVVSVFQAVSGG